MTRFVIPTEPVAVRDRPSGKQVAVSPDGSVVAYIQGEGDLGRLYLRRLDSTVPVLLESGSMLASPFFSPDGTWIGYRSGRELRRISVEGGKSWKICDVGWVAGGTWRPDGTIVYADPLLYGLWQVPWEGGEPVLLTKSKRDGTEGVFVGPQFLPGGDTVLFNVIDTSGVARQVATVDIATGLRQVVLDTDGFTASYVPSGHLVYGRDGSLMVAPFDLETRKVEGRHVEVLDDLLMGFPMDPALAHFAVSDSGTLVYVSGPMIETAAQIAEVNRDGRSDPPLHSAQIVYGPRYSPDGLQISMAAAPTRDSPVQVWVRDLARGTFTRLTPEEEGWWPLWSPDGARIFFPSRLDASTITNLAWVKADGSALRQLLTEGELGKQPTGWSPDGRTLIYHHNDHPETGWDVMAINLDDSEPQMLLGSRYNEMLGSLSPDGRWLAYVSDESGRLEVYVRSYPDLDQKWQISTDGGIEPAWSHDGRELFYRSEDGRSVMALPITAGPEFSPGRPGLLFEGEFAPSPWFGRNFDVAADGQTFLMVEYPLPDDLSSEVKVVVNWFHELERVSSE